MLKKKLYSAIACCLMATTLYAQYPQTLPITHTSFFATTAVGANSVLEKADYDATSKVPIMANQWNLTGASATSYEYGSSATVENSTLSYSNYVDNNAGKAIVLDKNIPGQRRAIYSLTAGTEYRKGVPYYLSFLVNFSNVPAAAKFFVAWDGNYTCNQQRGILYVKANKKGFSLGLGLTNNPASISAWSSSLSLNQVHLVVMKVTPVSTGETEIHQLYINPSIDSNEENSTSTVTVQNDGSSTSLLSGVEGITMVQNTGIGAKIAGLRFSDKWSEVVASK